MSHGYRTLVLYSDPQPAILSPAKHVKPPDWENSHRTSPSPAPFPLHQYPSPPPCDCSPSWTQAWENLHTPDRSTHIRWPNIAHNNVISPPSPSRLSPPRPHPSLPSSISALLFIPNPPLPTLPQKRFQLGPTQSLWISFEYQKPARLWRGYQQKKQNLIKAHGVLLMNKEDSLAQTEPF